MQFTAPPDIPDEENFFMAPVFETFVFRPEDTKELAQKMQHQRFLQMCLPAIKQQPGDIEFTYDEKFEYPNIQKWADTQRKLGNKPPEGLSDAAWLHSVMPKDETIEGLRAALARPRSMAVPSFGEISRAMGTDANPFHFPLPAISGVFDASRFLNYRATAAAKAGDAREARDLVEINLRLAEGFSSQNSLVAALVGIAVDGEALSGLKSGVESRCWNDADLELLASQLPKLDVEAFLLRVLTWGEFRLHTYSPGYIHQCVKEHYFAEKNWQHYLIRLCPNGIFDANLANYLKWSLMLQIRDTPGDDLANLIQKQERNQAIVREEYSQKMNPRTMLAAMEVPAMSGITEATLTCQLNRRQLQAAIAVERYFLKTGTLPADLETLVPTLLTAVPADPWKAGAKLQLSVGKPGEKYRITSVGKDADLVMR